MIRPYYETEEDVLNEIRGIEYIAKVKCCKYFKLPIKYSADYITTTNNNKPTALYELKNRPISVDTYESYMISLYKFQKAMTFAEIMNIPFFIYVEWTNPFKRGIVRCTRDLQIFVWMQTKNYRNDPNDIEPCLYIPINLFITGENIIW